MTRVFMEDMFSKVSKNRDIQVMWDFWGKTNDMNRPTKWKSVLEHCIDVGAVAHVLLRDIPTLRNFLARRLRIRVSDLRSWLPFWIACHDIGKISPPFQYNSSVPQELRVFDQTRYPNLGVYAVADDDVRHERATQYILGASEDGARLLSRVVSDARLRRALCLILGTHHARAHVEFIGSMDVYDRQKFCDGNWPSAQEDAFEALRKVFLRRKTIDLPLPSAASGVALAGFLALCDWFGSNQKYFPTDTEIGVIPSWTLAQYKRIAIKRAKAALKDCKLFNVRSRRDQRKRDWTNAFPNHSAPYPVQKLVIDEVDPARQFLAIVCDGTGTGKTEIGMWLAEAAKKTRGCAFLLPTRATSNGLFERMKDYVNSVLGGKLIVPCDLVHSTRQVVEGRREIDGLDMATMEDAGLSAMTNEFFRGKKGLLADYLVATVDQAAMGVICSSFFFFRLFALAGRTIILDEIHAYDDYTQRIIIMLLPWLKALGCNIVVMSATMTIDDKAEFLEAWGAPPVPRRRLAEYPSCIVCQRGRSKVRALPVSSGKRKKLKSVSTLSSGLREIVKKIADGGIALVYVNTIEKAIRLAEDAEAFGMSRDEILCAHSRMIGSARLAVEDNILDSMGREGRPHRLLVISTQVCELSLNIDADIMLSDVCPIDILIQRLGRLHRFNIARPAACRNPVMLWTCDDEEGLRATYRVYGVPGNGKLPRSNYLIDKTIDVLRGRTFIEAPTDVQPMIEQVYASDGSAEHAGFAGLMDAKREEASRIRICDEASPKGISKASFEQILFKYKATKTLEDEDGLRVGIAVRDALPKKKLIVFFRRRGKIYLDPDFTYVVDVNMITLEEALGNSVEVHVRDYEARSAKSPMPLSWEKKYLRYYVPEFFETDAAGRLVNGTGMAFDRMLGIMYT